MRAWLGGQADLLLEGPRVVLVGLLASGFVFDFPDVHRVLTDLCRSG